MTLTKGYAKKGKRCIIRAKNKGNNISLIAAITKKRLLGYQIFRSSIKANDFAEFIIEILNQFPEIKDNRSHYFFFWDNTPIHKSKSLQEYFKNFNIIYNAPY